MKWMRREDMQFLDLLTVTFISNLLRQPGRTGETLVPHGATTIIADPHEIVNVCGIKGLDYMMEAAKGTALDIKYMLPSCVPATPFEHAGAVINAPEMEEPIQRDGILGLGEFYELPWSYSGG